MHKEQELSLLHITAQYVAEVQAGRQPRLSDYLARYPRYADAIADFVAYYHAVEEVRPSGELASAGTMTTLLATATGQRLTLSQIAAELNLSIDIVLLLEQRAIAPATIPHVLCEQIAILLQQSDAVVQEYLCSLGQQPGSAVQKRKQQRKVAEDSADYSGPHVMDKLDFRAVVETSLQLSAEQKSRWRTILDAEGS